MCGINGFNWRDENLIYRMNKKLSHRGPDSDGIYVDDFVTLGHRRLSIIDLSEKGKQPMTNENRNIWLVYNGMIYNYRELREYLKEKNHVFISNSDTEVIIHAYEEFGEKCLDKFNGMFAFVLYDKNQKKIFGAVDRFGIKPFYYYWNGNHFIFSSEIKAILEHDIPREPNDKIIFDYLYHNVNHHSEFTFFKGIKRLLPGHYLVLDLKKKEMKIYRWYELKNRVSKRKYIKGHIRELFEDCVRKRLISDVPVGLLLSGGVDSSSIVCFASELKKNYQFETFSAVYPGEKCDESKYISEVIKKTNVKANFIKPSADSLLNDLYDLIYHQEEPFTSTNVYAHYCVMKLVNKRGFKVVLNGQGGDELFIGDPNYFSYYFLELAKEMRIFRLIKDLYKFWRNYRNIKPVLFFITLLIPNIIKNFIKKRKKIDWIHKNFFNENIQKTPYANIKKPKSLNDFIFFRFKVGLPGIFIYEDKNAMRYSIESRPPYMDFRLVEYLLGINPEEKMKNMKLRYLQLEEMKDILPLGIINRRDKIGFATPEDRWFKSPTFIKFFMNTIESSSFKSRKYWDYKKIKKEFEEYIKGKRNLDTNIVWKWVNLEIWLRIFFDSYSQ